MKKISRNEVKDFITYYHHFHDSYITNINYDISKAQVEMTIDVCWSGKPILNDNKTYTTNKTKIKMLFINVEKIKIIEIESWEYVDHAYLQCVTIDNKEYFCFADKEDHPLIYILSTDIEYEEIS